LGLNSSDPLRPFSSFLVNAQHNVDPTPIEETDVSFSILGFNLPPLNTDWCKRHSSSVLIYSSNTFKSLPSSSTPNKISNKKDNKYISSTTNHLRAAKNILYGETEFLPPIQNTEEPEVLESPKFEHSLCSFLYVLLNRLFEIFDLPYSCQKNVKIEDKAADLVIYRNKDNVPKNVMLIIEVKRDLRQIEGVSQAMNYSRSLLAHDKFRFMVLSMVCDYNVFAFYCTFRFGEDVACVRLGDYDYFNFGINALGLLKLIFTLELPWSFYGSMLVNENGQLNVWRQKRLLGSGSTAEVYEYKDDLNNSKVIKFFRSNCVAGFQKEVEIYDKLKSSNISLHMLWHNREKLIVCTDRVRETITSSSLNLTKIGGIFTFLKHFHDLTGHAHRDIHPMNILTVDNQNIVFNDFASAVPFREKHSIWGNSFFASDRILRKSGEIKYYRSDDLYSLIFSLVFIMNFQKFDFEFKKMEDYNTQTILQKRNQILKELENNSHIFKAFEAAKKNHYKFAKKHILEYFKIRN
jgi:serine/threonine protein kinase